MESRMQLNGLRPAEYPGQPAGSDLASSDESAVESAAWTDSPSPGPPAAPMPTAGHVSKKRVVGIDAARGVALLGMVAVHALYAANAQGSPTVSYTIAAGRAAALFAVLAGVGISLSTGRRRATVGREGTAAAASLVARALALAVIGLALGYADSTIGTVILVYYGALFLLAIPLLFLPTRAVMVTGVVIAFVVPVLSHLVRGGLPAPLYDHPTATYLLASPVRVLADVFVTGEYPALPWLAYVCAGLAIGRLQLSSLQVARRLFGAGVTMAVVAKLVAWVALGPLGGSDRIFAAAPAGAMTRTQVSELLAFGGDGTTPVNTWWWLASAAPHISTPLDLVHTVGTAMAVIGLMLLLTHAAMPARAAWATSVLKPLSVTGSMTLTLYTAHIVFMNSSLDVFGAWAGYLVQIVAAIIFALVWSSIRGRGPLESVVTSLSHAARDAVISRPVDGAHRAARP